MLNRRHFLDTVGAGAISSLSAQSTYECYPSGHSRALQGGCEEEPRTFLSGLLARM